MTQSEGPLRAARLARGWSQSRAVKELIALALERGVTVAAPVSLKTQLSRWENQHAVPDDHYRGLLCELYASTEAELGLGRPAPEDARGGRDAEVLRDALRAAAAIDDAALTLLRVQLRTSRGLDSRLGAAAVADSARSHLSYLEQVLAHAIRPRLRRDIASLVVDAASLSGRLALDQARHADAWLDYETAKAAAREAESSPLLGYVMVEQASVLLDAGEYDAALNMVEQAVAAATDETSTPMRAWLESARGVALAMAGASDEARSAFRRSERRLGERPYRIDIQHDVPFLNFDFSSLLRHRGHAFRVLYEQEAAIDDLERALREGGGSTRDIAGVHVDLTYAHGAVGHTETAAEHARTARDLLTRIGSTRLAAQLDAAPVHAAADAATGN